MWRLQVNDTIRFFHRDRWVLATAIEYLSPELNPQQQVTGWKIRLDSGRVRYIWESSLWQLERVVETNPT